MNRNARPEWIGIGVRNHPESVSGMAQNTQVVDLREADEETKTFRRTIVRTLDPNEYNIHIAEFLI
jgi:hypothetical protein